MGLDQYLYRVTKPEGVRKNRVYDEGDALLNGCAIINAKEIDSDMYVALKPFTVPIKVLSSCIDMDKIRKDFNLSDEAYVGSFYSSKYHIYDKESESANVVITDTEMKENYTSIQYQDIYVCKCEQIHYWRKNYEISDFLNDQIPNLENCGFYPINRNLAEYLQDFDGTINLDDFPEADSNVMYHEWY